MCYGYRERRDARAKLIRAWMMGNRGSIKSQTVEDKALRAEFAEVRAFKHVILTLVTSIDERLLQKQANGCYDEATRTYAYVPRTSGGR